MLALKLFTVANLHFNSVEDSKLPCCNLPPTEHHSFFRNLTPLFLFIFLFACLFVCLFNKFPEKE